MWLGDLTTIRFVTVSVAALPPPGELFPDETGEWLLNADAKKKYEQYDSH